MHPHVHCAAAGFTAPEMQRLIKLLPVSAQGHVAIIPAESCHGDLIAARTKNSQTSEIQIHFQRWQTLTLDQRNLLFWHVTARLHSAGRESLGRDIRVIQIGFAGLLLELLSQNLVGVATTLAVAGLAGYRIYQHVQGEQALRAATAADQSALQQAVEQGYSEARAVASLASALKWIIRDTPRTRRKEYQVRLRVLEILQSQRQENLAPLHLNSSSSVPSLV